MEKLLYERDGTPIAPGEAVKVRADVFPGSAHLHVEHGGIVCGMVSITWTAAPEALEKLGASVADFIVAFHRAQVAANDATNGGAVIETGKPS